MGIKDLFSSDARNKKRIDRWIRTAINPYAQSADRYHAMQQLLDDGSEDALVGVFKRFTIASTKSIEDEEEKGWAYRKLSALGPKVLPAAKRFCLEDEPSIEGRKANIAWALRIVEDVADADQEWDILEALLEKFPPEYVPDSTPKQQMLTHLAEIDDPKTVDILMRYLDDPDENIRFQVIEALFDIADPRAKDALVARLVHPDEDSVRLKTRILDGLADTGWDVSEHTEALAPHIGNEHAISGGKVVRR
ncbi:MAG: HEAT repeat domain-containing protein [Deltaproteobacteria bacterium]|nr:MAG: HEAT repeat domain-containing protein [Deltaproteobacteria bacterium]